MRAPPGPRGGTVEKTDAHDVTVSVLIVEQQVVIDLGGESLAWISFGPETARALARMLETRAAQIELVATAARAN